MDWLRIRFTRAAKVGAGTVRGVDTSLTVASAPDGSRRRAAARLCSPASVAPSVSSWRRAACQRSSHHGASTSAAASSICPMARPQRPVPACWTTATSDSTANASRYGCHGLQIGRGTSRASMRPGRRRTRRRPPFASWSPAETAHCCNQQECASPVVDRPVAHLVSKPLRHHDVPCVGHPHPAHARRTDPPGRFPPSPAVQGRDRWCCAGRRPRPGSADGQPARHQPQRDRSRTATVPPTSQPTANPGSSALMTRPIARLTVSGRIRAIR